MHSRFRISLTTREFVFNSSYKSQIRELLAVIHMDTHLKITPLSWDISLTKYGYIFIYKWNCAPK